MTNGRKRRGQRNRRAKSVPQYSQLETRNLLTTITVDTIADSATPVMDGKVSLREAIVAANFDIPYGDAPAGTGTVDVIRFSNLLDGQTISLTGGELLITDGVAIRTNSVGITIDANFESRIFRVQTSEDVELSGLRLTRGQDISGGGGAILAAGGGNFELDRLTFISNTTPTQGGAVRVSNGTMTINRSTFHSNSALAPGGRGGAIYNGQASLEILDSSFTYNQATRSGGAVNILSGSLVSRNVTYGSVHVTLSNRATGQSGFDGTGGAVFLDIGSEGTFSSDRFMNNIAGNAGGGIFARGNVKVHQTSFSDNRAIPAATPQNDFSCSSLPCTGGGAIFIHSTEALTVTQTAFQGNRTNSVGGAIRAVDVKTVGFYFSSLTDNRAAFHGGGVYLENGNLRARDTIFLSNEAVRNGGAIAAFGADAHFKSASIGGSKTNGSSADGNLADAGAGLYIVDSSLRMVDSALRFNNSLTGSGLYAENTESLLNDVLIGNNQQAGAAVFMDGTLRLQNSTVHDNTSSFSNGGGLTLKGKHIAAIVNSTFSENVTAGKGAGIQITDEVEATISGSYFVANQARTGGGIFTDSPLLRVFVSNFTRNRSLSNDSGAGIHTSNSSTHIRNSNFDDNIREGIFVNGGSLTMDGANVTDNNGSGLVVTNAAEAFVANSTFSGNHSASNGGAVQVLGAKATFSNTLFENNSAVDGGAIFAEQASQLLVRTNSTFRNNNATGTGGAISLIGMGALPRQFDVRDTLFEQNVAEEDGGAIAIAEDLKLTIRQSVFDGNESSANGGAIANNARLFVFDSEVINNTAAETEGGIFKGDDGTQTIVRTTFTNNVP